MDAQQIITIHPNKALAKTMDNCFSEFNLSIKQEDKDSWQNRSKYGLPRIAESPLIIIGNPYFESNLFPDAPEQGIRKLIDNVKEKHGHFAAIVVNPALPPRGWSSSPSNAESKDFHGVPIVLLGAKASKQLMEESKRLLRIRRGLVSAFAHDAAHALTALSFYLSVFTDTKRKEEMQSTAKNYEDGLRKFNPKSSGSQFLLTNHLGAPYVTPITNAASEESQSQGTVISADYLETQVGASLIVESGIKRLSGVVAEISTLYDLAVSKPNSTELNLALQKASNAADDFYDFLKVVGKLWTTRINSGEG